VSESGEKCDLLGGRWPLLLSRETGYRFIDSMLRCLGRNQEKIDMWH
jgi:hypothetical protein